MDQAIKEEVMKQRREFEAEKEECIAKMQATPNPFKKAMLYHGAVSAVEKMTFLSPVSFIPDNDGVIELANGLVMRKEGNLYQSTGPLSVHKKLFGSALISMVDPETVQEQA